MSSGTLLAGACGTPPQQPGPRTSDSSYLYLWTAGADSTASDNLAVYDVRPDFEMTGVPHGAVFSIP